MPQARSLLQVLPAVLLMSLISTVMAFSFAAMMVHTTQQALLPDMVMALLFTAMVSALFVAWKGSMAGLIAIPLPSAAAMFADMFQRTSPSPDEIWLLVLLGSLLTAGLMLLLGSLKLSRVVRYLPLPVLAGFLAGVGWLFIKGGLALVGLKGFQLEQLQDSALWMGLAFAALLWLLRQRVPPAYLLPGAALLGGVVMILLAPWLQNQGSWFFELDAAGSLPIPLYHWMDAPPAFDWLQLPWNSLLTLALISVLSMLLQATSIELLAKQDLDLDRELKVAGGMNLLNAAVGGSVGSLSLSQTSMVRQMQANQRLTGILMALLLLLALFLHEYLLRWLPLPLVAGLLVFQGLQFVHQWLLTSGKRFQRADQLVIAVIFVMILLQGFLGGVLLGLLLTVLLFIREYSRLQAIHLNTNLAGLSSGVERTPQEHEWLKQQAGRVRVYQLRGFLFFGTANTLTEQIKSDVQQRDQPIQALLLDFQRVSNADSSTANSLLRLKQFCDAQQIQVHISGLRQVIQQQLQAAGLMFRKLPDSGAICMSDQLEEALEVLENQLLQELQLDQESPVQAMLQHRLILEEHEIRRLLAYFREETCVDGQWILRQGQQERVLYILASGSVEVGLQHLETDNWIRLKKMRPGTLLGEMGLYLGEPRSASARAVGATRVLALTHTALLQMEARDPDLALAFHRFVVLMQSERLRESNRRLYSVIND